MNRIPQPQPARRGSTLSEVMIAVLVISIGVVSVGSLFPLSVARAIQANKVTQATVLRYDAEAFVDSLKLADYELFFGPNGLPGGPGDDNLDGSINIATWDPGADGMPGRRGMDDDGNGVIDFVDANGDGIFNPAGGDTLDLLEFNPAFLSDDMPVWDMNEVLWPGSDDQRIIVIDPLGYYLMAEIDGSVNVPASFALNVPNWRNLFGGAGVSSPIIRRSGGHRGNNYNSNIFYNFTRAQAERIVTLGDQWTTLLDVPLTNPPGPNSLVLPNTVDANIMNNIAGDLQQVPAASPVLAQTPGRARIVLFGTQTGTNRVVTYTREILGTSSGRTVNWATNEPLPITTPTNFQAERAVLQKLNADFTWMITSRIAPPNQVDMDVVVFFKRKFQASDERIFGAPGSNPPTTNQVRLFNPPAPIKDPYTVTVGFSGTAPNIQKGSFMFDVTNGYWYRITEMKLTNSTMVVFTVDRLVYDGNGDGYIRVAFPENVVDVYAIGRQNL